MGMSQNDAEKISGSVERITYYNQENGYTVLRLRPEDRGLLPFKYASGRGEFITVVGNLPELNPGEWLKLTGNWVTHPRHGRQFKAEHCEQVAPASVEGIKRYLGSGLIRGIGPVMAERIVEKFGDQALDVIELEPGRLRQVEGIGPKRVSGVIEAWEEQKAIKDVMVFLQSHGVSTNLALKIYRQYGDDSLGVVRSQPYKLVKDVRGVGFLTADKIAQALGLAHDDPGRIEAGVAYTLGRMADDGHVYVPQEELEPEAAKILNLEQSQVAEIIDRLEKSELIKRETITYQPEKEDDDSSSLSEERAVYLTPFYFSEIGLARRIQEMIQHPTSRLSSLRNRILSGDEIQPALITNEEKDTKLSDHQDEAVKTAIINKVTVLTGGPGTGKTTTLRWLLNRLDEGGFSYALASPTGRAAKRVSEATGRPAKTIHRLLEFNPGEGFGRNDDHQLDVDMVIIDEASMLDLTLANNLLKAVPVDSHLLLVGDIDQLPSVGAGDVLADLIDSGVTAVVRLEFIFRQAAGSLIVANAHRINQGKMPFTPKDATDFFLFTKQDPEETAELLVDIVKNRIPGRFGLDSLDDIQVLSPMYQGQAGVNNLNLRLQEQLNSPGGKMERRLGGRTFRVGDKVMQTVNNYDKNVFNGDIGRVTSIDPVDQTMGVNIDGAPVVYDFMEVDELVHAYAITVHKSQGSEYRCVVIPLLTQHYLLLQRNLLYTAVTRAKELVVLVGTRQAIGIAISNNRVAQRYTALDWRLKNGS